MLLSWFFFFFQAEDGIRDRSPSRGLGDVYKRQAENAAEKMLSKMCSLEDKLLCACEDSYLPEKYIEQTKQLITTRIAVLKEG